MIRGPEFENLKADIAKQGVLVKIMLFRKNADETLGSLRVLDGRNRLKAACEVGFALTDAHFDEFSGSYAEAEAYVLSTNFHRRQLTNAQKQEVIRAVIEKHPAASNRQIARLCNLSSHATVAAGHCGSGSMICPT
jgi:ParB-like chromosome segregation protein Spo0J